MRLLWIVNDYGKIENPIGCYAERIINIIESMNIGIDIIVETGSTTNFGKLRRWISPEMTVAILRAVHQLKYEKIDAIFVEYPFAEYNPAIVLAYGLLWRLSKAKNCMLILSIHEYFRTKLLRRIVTRFLSRHSDVLFVTDEATKNHLCNLAPKCFVRNIFCPISISWEEDEKKEYDRSFIYFGLINRSKAFEEMLLAFSRFNSDGKKHLSVYTSTEIGNINLPEGVDIYYARSDQELMRELKKATFCILPIKPEINVNNSSFIGAAQAGCTLIGHFSEKIGFSPFMIDVLDYSSDNFATALEKGSLLPEKDLENNTQLAVSYGKQFSADKTVLKILEAIQYDGAHLQ